MDALPAIGTGFRGDPAGEYQDGLTDDIRARMKRIPTVVAILRQLDRVSYLLSSNADAANAILALKSLASSYVNRVDGWKERWENRPCAGIHVGGKWVPVPQPADYGSWFQLIIDGLTEAGVIFEETRISYVGPRPKKEEAPIGPVDEGPKLLVGPPRVEPVVGAGEVGKVAASGIVGGRAGLGLGHGVRTLGVRVRPWRGPERPAEVAPGPLAVEATAVEPAVEAPALGFRERLVAFRAYSEPR